MWLLRAYNGVVKSSNQKWSGFGDGKLRTGVDANGAGVLIQYMTQCASTVPTSPISAPSATSHISQPDDQLYKVSTTHKILAPLSIGLLLPATILFRLAAVSPGLSRSAEHSIAPLYLSVLIGVGAYGIGIAGLASSFTTIKPTISVQKRSTSNLTLKTGHGKAGLALFVCLYGLVPIMYLLHPGHGLLHRRQRRVNVEKAELPLARANYTDTREKLALANDDSASGSQSGSMHTPPASRRRVFSWGGHSSGGIHSPPDSPRRRAPSWGGHSLWRRSRTHEPRASSDTVSTMSVVGQPRAFEVINRPQRIRRASATGPNSRVSIAPKNLGDFDWLERRRTIHAAVRYFFFLCRSQRSC
jgi:hypothetical protein